MSEKQQIVSSIAKMGKQFGRAPSQTEFVAQTGISKYFVLKWFRSWTEAVQAVGLEPSARNARVDDRALLEDWGRTVRKCGGLQPRHLFRRTAKYNPCTLAKRFGRWSAVGEAFRKFAKGKREWVDVVALLGTSRPPEVRARAGRRRAAEDAMGAKDVIGGVGASRAVARKAWHRARTDRPICGNPTPYRWLRHEPVNEQGVVLLFGMLVKELGYVIETVQQGFPDCEAKRQVGADRWQRVRIEFEFESRNFREHGHRPDGCDMIVCWKHNWEECPKEIEVMELAGAARRLEVWRDAGAEKKG